MLWLCFTPYIATAQLLDDEKKEIISPSSDKDETKALNNNTDIESLFKTDDDTTSPTETLYRPEMINMPKVRLRALDKITGRTQTFDSKINEVLKFGSLFIRVRSCQKAAPTEKPESASFIQVWEDTPEQEPTWIFSNWMFASTPALSAMEHPIYDIWVLECIKADNNDSSDE